MLASSALWLETDGPVLNGRVTVFVFRFSLEKYRHQNINIKFSIHVHFSVGEKVKPLTKGKVSAYAGPAEKVFSPAHVTLSVTNRDDFNEDTVNDKVREQCVLERLGGPDIS